MLHRCDSMPPNKQTTKLALSTPNTTIVHKHKTVLYATMQDLEKSQAAMEAALHRGGGASWGMGAADDLEDYVNERSKLENVNWRSHQAKHGLTDKQAKQAEKVRRTWFTTCASVTSLVLPAVLACCCCFCSYSGCVRESRRSCPSVGLGDLDVFTGCSIALIHSLQLV